MVYVAESIGCRSYSDRFPNPFRGFVNACRLMAQIKLLWTERKSPFSKYLDYFFGGVKVTYSRRRGMPPVKWLVNDNRVDFLQTVNKIDFTAVTRAHRVPLAICGHGRPSEASGSCASSRGYVREFRIRKLSGLSERHRTEHPEHIFV